jgi:hypothetical protein
MPELLLFKARQACLLAKIILISASGQPAISLTQIILEYGFPQYGELEEMRG